jgi:methionyl-tRNA synthetase
MSGVPLADFKKIELRVAKILDVEEIPGADKIWKLRIDVGAEQKEIVAGVKAFYTREALLGRSIIVVNNLEPAVIRGVESKGMLLAAKDGTILTLLSLEKDLPPGSIVG